MDSTTPDGTFRLTTDRRSPRRARVNLPLRFLDEVVGLEHLHYGLFDGDPLDRSGLIRAQERYLDELIAMIPEGVKRILDVGAGTGALSRRLASLGFEVEGLSPDPHQRERYRESVGRPFHLGRFQEFDPPDTFDLVILCESAQYIWLPRLFPAIRRAAPQGYALITDYFVLDPVQDEATSGHPLARFRQHAEDEGLELEAEIDVTERAAVTLDLAQLWISRYLRPSVGILTDWLERRRPWLLKLARWLGRRQIADAQDALSRVDPELFRQRKRYLFLRYRVASR